MGVVAVLASDWVDEWRDIGPVLWVAAGVAAVVWVAVLLAFVPRLPTAEGPGGLGSSTGGVRITSGTNPGARSVQR